MVASADQPRANYWIRAIGLRDCIASNAIANAILKYQGANDEDPDGDPLTYRNGTVRHLRNGAKGEGEGR